MISRCNLFFYCLALAVVAGAAGAATQQRLAFSEKLGVEVYALPDLNGVWCQPTMTLNIMVKDNSALLQPGGLNGFLPKLNAVFADKCPQATAAKVSVIKSLGHSVVGSLLNISKADGWAINAFAPETISDKNNKLIGQETSIQENSNKQITNNCIGDCINGQGTLTYADGTKYEGSFKNGKREGKGTVTMLNGNKYVGEWLNDVKDGYGILTLENGTKYDGNFRYGKYNGQGTLTQANGEKFVGEFKNGKFEGLNDSKQIVNNCIGDCINGQGTLTYADGTKYEGAFKNGKREGQGAATMLNGNKYVGEWKNDVKDGNGMIVTKDGKNEHIGNYKNGYYIECFSGDCINGLGMKFYENGDNYSGEWKYGKFNGKGTLFFKHGEKQEGQFKDGIFIGDAVIHEKITNIDGSAYEGEIKNGKYHGKGKRTYPDGSSYEGEYKDGKREGHGILITKTNSWRSLYEGEWKDDKRNGKGTWTFDDGRNSLKYIGEWKDNKKDGQGYLTASDGTNQVGLFKNDEFTGQASNNIEQLTEQSIKNTEFVPLIFNKGKDGFWELDSSECKITLKKGNATACEREFYFNEVVFGDLNGDNINDAAVSISENPLGGNGINQFVVVFLNKNGKPQFSGGTYFGEKYLPSSLESMEIRDQKIFMNVLGAKEGDPNCCPSQKLNEVYQLKDKGLILVSSQVGARLAQNNQQFTTETTQNFLQKFAISIDLFNKPLGKNIMDIISQIIPSAIFGALFGAFFSQKLRPVRKWIGIIIVFVLLGVGFFYFEPARLFVSFIVSFIIVSRILRVDDKNIIRKKPTIYGSAEWATIEHLQQSGKLSDNGLFLGDFNPAGNKIELKYSGDRHLLTVAPTRSGKGASSIVPNLLSYQGSMLVIDPKGENAQMTARYRGASDGLGQTIHIVAPWGITGMEVSCFNPLDWLSPDDEDISENAMILADSIITHHQGSNEFFDEESKALLMGLILYVALDEKEQGNRTLGRVRDIIVSSDSKFEAVMQQMFKSTNPIVSSTAARTASKEIKLLSNVIASLQSHTHFLDSPRIRNSLSKSDFKFEDLKTSKMTIYLVLPADRLETFGRWLRLLIQQSITVNARSDIKPEKPILFMLDEMPALGRLAMVEQAYGLMAGFGMQLWGIVQDLSQLERVYDKGWETFIGNSGVLQYFGSRDQKTAEYFSKLCGVTTVEKVSVGSSIARGISSAFGTSSSVNTSTEQSSNTYGRSNTRTDSTTNTDTVNTDLIQRHLAYPDELMVLKKERQLLFIEHLYPIDAKKIEWYDDPRFENKGVNLHKKIMN